jgi:crotonobetainyl-CoA:carnitine CoA-transferase CaiB-like acyl-CoA transferase
MTGYDFLSGVRVVEVAQLGPSSLGGYLADMGAEVIKVEDAEGEPVRNTGTPAVGSADGYGFLHLRWNRGKRSIGIDLKQSRGRELFEALVARSDVVIEGMRAGILDRLGLSYDRLRELNPSLVFCSISGLGSTGPYHTLGSHGPSYDAFAGLSSVNPYSLTDAERAAIQHTAIGMHSMGLHAAVGTLAAIVKAQRTGEGSSIEVAACDSAAHWRPDGVDVALNRSVVVERPGFLNAEHKQFKWPRMSVYETKDQRRVFFQGLGDKFWKRFCDAIDRLDLVELYEDTGDPVAVDDRVHTELVDVFPTRTLDEWMDFFRQHDVPGSPVNTFDELSRDPHFLARENVYDVEYPGVGTLHLTTTPIKTPGQRFAPALAPALFEHTDQVAHDLLDLDEATIDRLRSEAVLS